MGTLFDYLLWRGDLTLEQSPLNPVDNVILTHLSYLPLNGIVPGPDGGNRSLSIAETAKQLAKAVKRPSKNRERHFMFKEDPNLLEALAAAPRFRDMGLTGFVNQHDMVQEKQFAALTVLTGDNSVFITYRGTDDTFIGWKEDFKLTFTDEIPSQLEAVDYLETMSKISRKPVRIGGHSKGGNLSVFAASFCTEKIRNRITEIYVNDAPGFNDKVLTSGGYREIRKKIKSFVPNTSVVGMLFERDYSNAVVKSSKEGLLQHDIYTWDVLGNDFVRVEDVDKQSRFIDRSVREWISSLDKEHLKEFTEALFTVLSSTEATSFAELGTDWAKNAMLMAQSFSRIKGRSREMLRKVLFAFLKSAQNNIGILLPEEIKLSGIAARRKIRPVALK